MGWYPVGSFSKVKTLTDPVVLPVDLDEAKDQCVIEHSDDDSLIYRYMSAVTNHIETITNMSLVMQKKRLFLNQFFNEVYLPKGPVKSIDQVQYIDGDGVTQTLSSETYSFDSVEPYLRLAYGKTWPSHRGQDNAVWIDYWCGYYDPAESPVDLTTHIPQSIKDAIYMMVADLYKNRESTTDIQTYKNHAFEMLIAPYRVYVQ